MTYVVPCEAPGANPEDWYIERDGLQYSDQPLLTEEREREIERETYPDAAKGFQQMASEEADLRRESLRRRRHAKDSCHVDCYFRLQCLELALDGPNAPETHGTWGGYYAEELREIRAERDRRRRPVD